MPQAKSLPRSSVNCQDGIDTAIATGDATVFGYDGNRKRGYRCAPCIQHKKGCKGNPPVCDTCLLAGRGKRCTFDPQEMEQAYIQQYEKSAAYEKLQRNKHTPTPIRSKHGGNRAESKPSKWKSIMANTTYRTYQPDGLPSQRNTHVPARMTSQTDQNEWRMVTREEYDEYLESERNRQSLLPSLSPIIPQITREQRELQQRRHIHTISQEEFERIRNNPIIYRFVRKYGSPMSQNLLPMVEIILESLTNDSLPSDPENLYTALTRRFDRIWDLARTFLPEVFLQNNHLSARKKYKWAQETFPRPLNERHIEDFFFAFICTKVNGWDESQEDKANENVLQWYRYFILPQSQWMRDSLYWHELMRFEWDVRRRWLEEWLRGMIEQYEIVTDSEFLRRMQAAEEDPGQTVQPS